MQLRQLFLSAVRHFATMACPILLALLQASPSPATDWASIHANTSHTRTQPISATITNLATSPTMRIAPGESLVENSQPILVGAQLLAVSRTAGTTPTCTLKSFSRATGVRLWQTAPLATGAYSYSLGVPTVDAAAGRVYFTSENVVYAFSLATGSTLWSTTLSASNTDSAPDARYFTVNTAATLGTAGRIYVQTYESNFFGPYTSAQVVCLAGSTGSVVWWQRVGGVGSASPLLNSAAGNVLCSGANASGQGVIRSLNGATGALQWSSDALPTSYTSTSLGWGDMALAVGTADALATTYNFSGTGGQLIRFDAATGALKYLAPALTTDSPPLVRGGSVVLFGGSYSAPRLARYDLATGALQTSAPTGGVTFRQYPAATLDRLYLAQAGQGLRTFDPASLTQLSGTAAAGAVSIEGPVALGNDGSVYVTTSDAESGGLVGWVPPGATSATGWNAYE